MPKRELVVTLETVTPMFLGGAEQQPELRAASFRGAMRFWLRALFGGLYGDDLITVKKKEAEVFGDTGRASAVVVRVDGTPKISNRPKPEELPRNIQYLFWTLFVNPNDKRQCIIPGSKFRVSLMLRPGLPNTEPLWLGGSALWLCIRLGGLGTRSRRTLGSLSAIAQSSVILPKDLPSFVSQAKTPIDLVNELQEGLNLLKSGIGQSNNSAKQFCTLGDGTCRIAVVANRKPWQTWQSAAEKLGSELKTLRTTIPNKQRVALGLPFRNSPREYKQIKRYASPFLLSIAPLESGDFVGTIVVFKPQLETDFVIPFDKFLQTFDFHKEIRV